jgi:hypothetical protein
MAGCVRAHVGRVGSGAGERWPLAAAPGTWYPRRDISTASGLSWPPFLHDPKPNTNRNLFTRVFTVVVSSSFNTSAKLLTTKQYGLSTCQRPMHM